MLLMYLVYSVGATEPPTRAGSLAPGQATEFAPLVIHIDYSLRNPVDGLEFILPTDAYPHVSHQDMHIWQLTHFLL